MKNKYVKKRFIGSAYFIPELELENMLTDSGRLKMNFKNASFEMLSAEISRRFVWRLMSTIQNQIAASYALRYEKLFLEIESNLARISDTCSVFGLDEEQLVEGLLPARKNLSKALRNPNVLYIREDVNSFLDDRIKDALDILKLSLPTKPAKIRIQALRSVTECFIESLIVIRKIFRLRYPDKPTKNFNSFLLKEVLPNKRSLQIVLGGRRAKFFSAESGKDPNSYLESLTKRLRSYKTKLS